MLLLCIVIFVFLMLETKSYRQNDRTDRRVISCSSWKNKSDIVFTGQIRVFHRRPISSILCIIDVSLFVQHICIYVFYIYIHIYIYVSVSVSGSVSLPVSV